MRSMRTITVIGCHAGGEVGNVVVGGVEAPGGVVEVRAACRDGRCESVEFTNVPCFADRLDAPLEVEGLGTISVDVCYGGMWYAIADAAALGFAIEPSEARELSLTGER